MAVSSRVECERSTIHSKRKVWGKWAEISEFGRRMVAGVAGLSMPIHSRDGEVRAAVGISGPSVRFTPKEVLAMRDALKRTIKEIEKQLVEDEPG